MCSDSWCIVGFSSSSSSRFIYCQLIYSLFQELVPSAVLTACCPFYQLRKQRKTCVICVQSMFCIVSYDSNRESQCWVGVGVVSIPTCTIYCLYCLLPLYSNKKRKKDLYYLHDICLLYCFLQLQ